MSAPTETKRPAVWEDLQAEIGLLESRSLRRSLRVAEQFEPGIIYFSGKPLIHFASNNYLGLARHPQVLEAVQQVMQHWGIGATSSRLIGGTTVIHHNLEQALAAFMQTEAALLFPAGYMANLAALTALVGPGDAIVMDRLCHASLVDAARLTGARLFVYSHADAQDAEKALKRAASYRRRLLLTESLFSMDGDFAPLPELAEAARRHQAVTLVDEAHAIGVWGAKGSGVRHPAGWDIVVGTLSKSLGSQGGFVACSKLFAEKIVNSARSFIYTTGLSPLCVAGAQAALSLVQDAPEVRERLKSRAQRLRESLQAAGFNTLTSQSHIIPIWLGEAEQALACSAYLEAAGIFAPAIRPPTVHAGQCRIRFSLTADHTEDHIDQLIEALKTWRV